MSHTPGPWELAMSADGCFILFGPKGRKLLTIPLDEQNEEKAANARLIAAAPELFEALRDIYAALVIEEISAETRTRARLRARDALALVRVDEGERR